MWQSGLALTLIGFSLPVRINLDSHIKGHEKPPRQTDVGQAPLRDVSQSDGGCDDYILSILSETEQ